MLCMLKMTRCAKGVGSVLVCWCVGVDVCMYAYIYVLCKPIDLCDSYGAKNKREEKRQ